MMWSWAEAFALTLLFEVPVAVVALRALPRLRVAAWAALCSAVTHPVLWAVWLGGLDRVVSYEAYVVIGEISVVAVEAAVLRRGLALAWRDAVIVSAAMNLVSWGMGELLRPWL